LFIQNTNLSVVGYGYGFLAVFIVTILSLAGLFAFPLIHKVAFQYVLVTFTALAVGTLLGDAMFHLIPFVCFDESLYSIDYFYYRHLVFIVMNRKNMEGMDMKKNIHHFLSLLINGKCSLL